MTFSAESAADFEWIVNHSTAEPFTHEQNILAFKELAASGLAPEEYKRIKAHIIEHNLRLVCIITKKYLQYANRKGLSYGDLHNVAVIGLNRAVEKFDPTLGYAFSTYAHAWIRQSITRLIWDYQTVRVPTHLNGQQSKLNRQKVDLSFSSLDAMVAGPKGSSDTRRIDQLVDEAPSPDNGIASEQARELLTRLVHEQLTCERERFIIVERFGLQGAVLMSDPDNVNLPRDRAVSLEQIGEQLGVSRERVRQLEGKALGKLRAAAEQAPGVMELLIGGLQ